MKKKFLLRSLNHYITEPEKANCNIIAMGKIVYHKLPSPRPLQFLFSGTFYILKAKLGVNLYKYCYFKNKNALFYELFKLVCVGGFLRILIWSDVTF